MSAVPLLCAVPLLSADEKLIVDAFLRKYGHVPDRDGYAKLEERNGLLVAEAYNGRTVYEWHEELVDGQRTMIGRENFFSALQYIVQHGLSS